VSITRETATPEDAPFLYDLVEETMRAYSEASFGPWDEPDVRRQIAAWFDEQPPQLLIADGLPIGVVRIVRLERDHWLDQIFISPTHQSGGIGSAVIREAIAEARAAGKPFRLRVWKSNPAKLLYDRLGFVVTEESPLRWCMEWRATP
jgi:ribosomal protein S18 acetylase RimI-like enzyme